MHREAGFAGASAVIAPLRCHDRRKLRIVCELVDYLLGRPGAPLRYGATVPPIEHVARNLRHRAGRKGLIHRVVPFAQRTGPGLDRCGLIGVAVLEVSFLRLIGAGKGQRLSITDVQGVVDRSQRREIDRRVGKPVKKGARAVSRSHFAQVVYAHVPSEPVAGEAVSQTAERLMLLKQQHLVSNTTQGCCGGHPAHAGPNHDGVPLVVLPIRH